MKISIHHIFLSFLTIAVMLNLFQHLQEILKLVQDDGGESIIAV